MADNTLNVIDSKGKTVGTVDLPAETFDVLVRPTNGRQFQILAESMGRQGLPARAWRPGTACRCCPSPRIAKGKPKGGRPGGGKPGGGKR